MLVPDDPDAPPRARVARFAAVIIACFRVGTLAQMVPSVAVAIRTSPHEMLCAVTWAVAGAALVAGAIMGLVRRAPMPLRLTAVDVALALALLLVGMVTVPVVDRTGTWIGFQCAYALCVGCSLAGVRRRQVWLGMLALLLAAEIAYLAPLGDSASGVATVTGNLLTLAILAPVFWVGVGLIYRMADEAYAARQQAAELARAAEERRARAAIHNGAAVMRLLLEYDAAAASQSARDRLRAQAEVEMSRMRAYLRGTAIQPRTAPQSLDAVVEGVAEEFLDLPVQVVSVLGAEQALAPEVAHDLAAALRSLLLNVRQHARATHVVLHLAGGGTRPEDGRDGGEWVLTVHDDGVGFDPATSQLGVGLGDLVVRQLGDHGITTEIASTPGLGTTVTLRADGACAAGPRPGNDRVEDRDGEVRR